MRRGKTDLWVGVLDPLERAPRKLIVCCAPREEMGGWVGGRSAGLEGRVFTLLSFKMLTCMNTLALQKAFYLGNLHKPPARSTPTNLIMVFTLPS